jgi:hypothetical protein
MKVLDHLMNNYQTWKVQVSLGLLTAVLISIMVIWEAPSTIWDFILGFSTGTIASFFLMSFTYKPVEE